MTQREAEYHEIRDCLVSSVWCYYKSKNLLVRLPDKTPPKKNLVPRFSEQLMVTDNYLCDVTVVRT